MPVAPWREVLSGFDILAICLSIGAAAAILWLLPEIDGDEAGYARIRRRLHGVLAAALALLSVTSFAELLARTVAISGMPLRALGHILPAVVTRTDFGHVWLVRITAVFLLWLVWSRLAPARRQPVTGWLLLVLAAIVAYTRSATGHAGDHGDFTHRVGIDWLHLLAAGLWGGVVLAFVAGVWRGLGQATASTQALIAARFSTLAAVGLALVAVTGVYNAWHALNSWQQLWTTRYGVLLAGKTALVIAMAVLGASNRFRHVPRILESAAATTDSSQRRSGLHGLAATAAAEGVLMLAIIAVVALLVNAMPPVDMP